MYLLASASVCLILAMADFTLVLRTNSNYRYPVICFGDTVSQLY